MLFLLRSDLCCAAGVPRAHGPPGPHGFDTVFDSARARAAGVRRRAGGTALAGGAASRAKTSVARLCAQRRRRFTPARDSSAAVSTLDHAIAQRAILQSEVHAATACESAPQTHDCGTSDESKCTPRTSVPTTPVHGTSGLQDTAEGVSLMSPSGGRSASESMQRLQMYLRSRDKYRRTTAARCRRRRRKTEGPRLIGAAQTKHAARS